MDADGAPWFLEVNVAPGMTETSLLPQSVLAAGRPLSEVYRQLVERPSTGPRKPLCGPDGPWPDREADRLSWVLTAPERREPDLDHRWTTSGAAAD